MNLITSSIGIAALSFVTLALAQEEQTTSPAPEEKPSTTIQETPAPAPETTTATTPSEQPATQTKEKPAAPAANQKHPASAKAPSPAVTAPARKMSVEATLKDNEDRWSAAIAKHDTATIESMVATDFIGVNSKGEVQNRRAMLADLKSDKNTYTSTKAEKLAVHMYGTGVAVVVGMSHQKGSGKDGKAFDRTYRFTDTWMDRRGSWQCVASQGTLVSQK
jgi:ketosteroid isomerase-like protein